MASRRSKFIAITNPIESTRKTIVEELKRINTSESSESIVKAIIAHRHIAVMNVRLIALAIKVIVEYDTGGYGENGIDQFFKNKSALHDFMIQHMKSRGNKTEDQLFEAYIPNLYRYVYTLKNILLQDPQSNADINVQEERREEDIEPVEDYFDDIIGGDDDT
jgi:hypothetical protein